MTNNSSKKKLRMIWNSNAIWSPSGYANQMAELMPLMRDDGYPLANINFYGLQGGVIKYEGITHYPMMGHVYGSDAMIHHGRDFNTDVTFSLQDTWVLNPQDLQQVKRWIPLAPVDHEPIPPPVVEKLRFAYKIISYSKSGYEEMKKVGLFSTYIQHTVNTDIFKPMDKKMMKKRAGLPEDCFLIGMVAANKDNPPRKSFQEVMDAFVIFLQRYPQALLYIHTDPDFPGGFPIRTYAKVLGIENKVLFPSPYQMATKIKKPEMAQIYNAFDLLASPSISEGFGVPIIEAQACGVPVIVNDFTSMPELIDNEVTGYKSEVLYRRFDGLASYVGIPSAKSIYDCMVKIKQSDRTIMGQKAREKMVKEYDTKKVYKEKWQPFLKTLEEEIYGKSAT